MTRPPFPPVTERDLAVVAAQLGRPARNVVGIAARCVCGNPVVVATAPRLGDGTPFPTFYYLTHPVATASMSFLEASQLMVECNEALADDPELAAAYRAAHEQYLADRELFGTVEEIAGISAGGMPGRVKCLHAVSAQALAAGPGVNPFGDLALARSSWSVDVCQCPDYGLDGVVETAGAEDGAAAAAHEAEALGPGAARPVADEPADA